MSDRDRLPPGQGATTGWPVLHVGEVPAFDPATWRLRVHGAVENPFELSWEGFLALPQIEVETDFHCVTGWSKLGLRWQGVRLAGLLALARPHEGAESVRLADAGGYDTGVPMAHALAPDVLLAHTADGAPLAPEHGAPLRAVVPALYAWKACKWVREVEVTARHRLGFWEARGYHDGADPWREERFVG